MSEAEARTRLRRAAATSETMELVKLFVERTGLPLYLGGEEKWAQALARMQQAGVEEADLEQAIDECRTQGADHRFAGIGGDPGHHCQSQAQSRTARRRITAGI